MKIYQPDKMDASFLAILRQKVNLLEARSD